mgnify:CR=1 FL=1
MYLFLRNVWKCIYLRKDEYLVNLGMGYGTVWLGVEPSSLLVKMTVVVHLGLLADTYLEIHGACIQVTYMV